MRRIGLTIINRLYSRKSYYDQRCVPLFVVRNSSNVSVTKLLPAVKKDELENDDISKQPSVLEILDDDVSDYSLHHSPSFNFAAYVNKSPMLQELIKLGVNLDKIEKTKRAGEIILRLNFENDVKPYVQFLHDNGVPSEELGNFITKNPFIFKEDLENLQIRINYLEAKLFTPDSISRIVTKNPRWLSLSTKQVDHKLGFFQKLFALAGPEVRQVAVSMPKIITYPLRQIEIARFGVIEEMGFSRPEAKTLLMTKPKVYTLRREDAVARFNYLHEDMGLTHSHILSQPHVLLYRLPRLRERHLFLKSIGKDQYDSTQPGYVSLEALVGSTDTHFCNEVAHSSVVIYNEFLKTL